ncbi:MAG TPA: MFS transporter [Baekduia sp.]|jgi:MFS family permease|nr:MFS transporter [Baekduia sp.]
MYQVSNSGSLLKAHRRLLATDRAARVPRTVVLLGITSLLTDISSEMVVTILPLYLISVGGFSPLAFGVVDGIYNGAAALVGLASGVVGDRFRRHKEVAAGGYGLSAICKLLLATIGTAVSAIGTVVLLDRIGKGIRTAPRDAMISLSTPKEHLGVAFGVHRALDTTGAMIGPLVAFLILAAAPVAFNSIFVVSFCIAILGVSILVLFVRAPALAPGAGEPAARASLGSATALLKLPRFRGLLLAGGALSLATASDAFIFLALQRKLDLGNSLFPLLFVGSSMTYMMLAVPIGRLADRVGRGRVLLGGYAILLATYAVVLQPLGGWPVLALGLGLLGTYYAATDGVLMALASSVVPDEVRGSGLALVGTVTNIARLVASIVFGAFWTVWGIHSAMALFGVALVAAILLAALVLHRSRVPAGL